MIDLSHLTEEEQEVIMTVLSRDAELKRAEDERIRKLENALNSGTQQPDSNLKYFTGEWFYEAKSRRHMDTIHGSEIILASIKRRKSALDGSIRMERSKSPSSQGSDLIPPPKPARTWEALQPQETNPTDKEALQIRSPRTPRHNPFNRASLLVVDPPEETVDVSHGAEQQSPAVTDCSGSRQTPAGSVTSDASSAGFRPVPKKRTFLSRRFSGAQDPETLGRPVGVVPAPRRSLQNSSNGSSHLSTVKPQDTNTETNATSPKQVMEFSQACSRSSLERNTPAPEKNSASSYITRDGEAEDGQVNLTQKPPVTTETVPPLSSNSIHNSEGEIISSVGSASRQELSLTRSSVAAEPSVSYDLNYIDKSDQQMQAKAKQELRLSPQMATPTGEEDDSITKVLDWFNRSSDSSDWLNNSEEKITKSSKDEYLASTEADPDTGKSHVPIEIHQQLKQEENNNENQHAKISYLKSFWEKSNAGPKVLISKSITSNDKESKTSKDEERCDTQSTTSIHNNMGVHQEDTDKLPDANCKYSDVSESIYITRANSSHQKETNSELQSLTGPEIHLVKTAPASLFAPNKQTNGISLLVEDLQFEEINKREKRIPEFQVQVKDNLESDQLVHLKPNKQISPKIQAHSSNEDMKRRKHRDRSPKSAPIKDRSPVFNRHVSTQDVPLKDKERIKHLKSFWEQERAKTGYIVKTRADLKSTSGKLKKRHAKSECDLQLIGKDSDSEEENRPLQLLSGVQSNQKAEKTSPCLGRRQFNSLREFWDEALSDSKSFTSDKIRSPKCKELPLHENKCGDPEVNNEKPSSRPPPPPYRPRLTSDKQTGSRLESKANHLNNHSTPDTMCQREVRRSSKDSGKVPKTRKDSCSPSSSRMNSFRRAKSMFSLSTDETDQIQIDVSPVHSHSRKQRANTEKGPGLRRQSEDTETLTPRARAFVPTDYRHYLGMTEKSSAHTSTTLPSKWSKEVKVDYDSSRRGSKTQQHPLSPNYTNSDTFHESLCNASESRPSSRLSSNRENDDSPVKRALRRAEARPKNLAKSLEDITAASTPRSERRQELSVDQRSSSDGSSLPSPLSSLYMDPEHTKKMSKSVPFLQNELSGSVMTIYSGDYGSVEVQGTIHFSIHYVQKLREFHIFVAQCKDLAPVDPKRGRSDPYVKSYLVPDKANLGKRKTSVKKKTLNPTFNEILRYRVRMEYLRTQTLILSVWHHDTFGKNSFLGEIDVDLSKWDFDHTQMNYLALKARTYPTLTPPNCRGEMRIAIRYVPQNGQSDGLARVGPNSGEIHIWVKECKNLPMIRATIDPYVKCFVLPDTSKKSRQKTRILRGTADPVFNHTMVYDGIRQADLTEACVELTVLDRDRLATNLLGGLRLGAGTGRSYGSLVDWMDSTAYEVALWDRMMASPNEWVEDVLPLRWLHSTKTTSK